MTIIESLGPYSDEKGNVIESAVAVDRGVSVQFRGSNNRLVVPAGARVGKLTVTFDCDNGCLVLGSNTVVGPISAWIRVGQDASIRFGDNVSTTETCGFSAVEGATITVGDDVMIASHNQIRTDDGHPIFDVRSGKRVNPAQDITIGSHVWLAWGACVLGGAAIGDGTVIGMNSLVTGVIPNNVIAVGAPARVIRQDIAWERPHLSLREPYYKPDASSVERSPYWNLTLDES